MINCHACGKQNIGNASFCDSCGQLLEKKTRELSGADVSSDTLGSSENQFQKNNVSEPLTNSKAEQGFFTMLLGEAEYSTARAKWFYRKCEWTLNILFKILLIFGALALIFTFLMNPYLGFAQLLLDIVIALFVIITIIFTKIFLMGVGAAIRAAEVLEEHYKK